MGDYRLEVRGLHKRFPGVYAVKDVSFQIAPGEVHALVSENGAGKSTLMKMITGEYTPDEGVVLHNGKEIHPKSISDSIKEGIAMIHQELAPLPEMNIAQLQAAESQGRDLILIGTDAIPDALQAVKDGRVAGSVLQDANTQASTAVDVVVKVAAAPLSF